VAALEAAWDKFVADPDWKKLSSDPKFNLDPPTVSNITSLALRPRGARGFSSGAIPFVDLQDQQLKRIFSPCTSTRETLFYPCRSKRGKLMPAPDLDLPQGTVDLLILRTFAPGANHGWAISERIHQVSSKVLPIHQGSLYPAPHRLERRGWIKGHWGASENNRHANFYELTRSGRKQMETEENDWKKLVAAIAQVLDTV
jgi:transcriptional regulator